MTVIAHSQRNQYTATAGQTVFNYTFEITDPTYLAVYKRAAGTVGNDTSDLLTYLTNYTVTGVNNTSGGTVVLNVGATVGDVITIEGNVPNARSTSFTPFGAIKAQELDVEFDNQVLIQQKTQTILDSLTPKYNISSFVQSKDLFLPILGARQFWIMNDTNTAINAETFIPSSDYASHAVGKGASLIGLQDQSNVTNKTAQDLANATFIAQTNNGSLQNAQYLAALATGILKSTTTTGVLSISSSLSSIDALTTLADQMLYTTGSNTYATTPFTAFARTLVDDATAIEARATLGSAILGANNDITSLSGLTGGISKPTFLTMAASGSVRTDTGTGNSALLQAYDVDGANYVTFATLTSNNTPTMDLDDAVTKAGGYIYRAGGVDVPILDGGTGSSSAAGAFNNLSPTTTKGDLIASNGTGNIRVPVGTDGQVLVADSSAASGLAYGAAPGIIPFTTKGDILSYNGTNNVRVAVGTDGQALVANSANASGLGYAGPFLPLTGGTISGTLNMGSQTLTALAAPSNPTDAVTKTYADTQLALKLNLSGGTMSGAIAMGTNKITGLGEPTLSQDAATKNYVDQTSLNGTSVYAATTANLTVTQAGAGPGATLTNAGAQAVFAIDGVSPPVGSNVLVKNLASAQNEGIYTVTSVGSGATNWVLTRATSYDTANEINNTGLIVINNGSSLGGQAWYNSATIATVDTTPFSYSRFGTTGTVTSIATSNGITGGTITTTGTVSLASMFTVNASAPSGSIVVNSTGSLNVVNQPSFHATLGTTVTNVTGDGTVYTIIFNSESYDIGSGYNNTTGIFTAPVAGDYLFCYEVDVANLTSAHTSGDGVYLVTSDRGSFFGNIMNYFATANASTGSRYVNGSHIVRMTAGGTAQVRVYISGGAKTVGISDNSSTRFQGRLLG